MWSTWWSIIFFQIIRVTQKKCVNDRVNLFNPFTNSSSLRTQLQHQLVDHVSLCRFLVQLDALELGATLSSLHAAWKHCCTGPAHSLDEKLWRYVSSEVCALDREEWCANKWVADRKAMPPCCRDVRNREGVGDELLVNCDCGDASALGVRTFALGYRRSYRTRKLTKVILSV